VEPPYKKAPELPLNDLGLPVKPYYTTQDVCKVLGLHPDTFRHRLRKGNYPEPKKIGGKRRFSESELKRLVKNTKGSSS
jgi:excisionase family DNA binding protein